MNTFITANDCGEFGDECSHHLIAPGKQQVCSIVFSLLARIDSTFLVVLITAQEGDEKTGGQ